MTPTAALTDAGADARARVSLADLRERQRAKQAEREAADHDRLEAERSLSELRHNTFEVAGRREKEAHLEAQRLSAMARRDEAARTADAMKIQLAQRSNLTELLGRLAKAKPAELEDGLECVREQLREDRAKIAAHAAQRGRLLRAPGSNAQALAGHDAARAELNYAVERGEALEADLAQGHADALTRWTALQARFVEDLRRARTDQAEAGKLLNGVSEKLGPRLAAILERLQEIDQHLVALREAARFLDRTDEVPVSANDASRPGMRPLYADGEVRLPGATGHAPLWPRRRELATRPRSLAADSSESTNQGAES